VRALVNAAVRPAALPEPDGEEAQAFHATLPGYAPTPVRELPSVAAELGLAAVLVKDESDRLGLPAFKVLGASWAVERALRERPGVTALVAASAGNHGRAVAHVAAARGLSCRIFLPAGSAVSRVDAIAGEGAEVVVIGGGYEEAVARAAAEGDAPGVAEIADVGSSGPARWVIDGYATLFAEAARQAAFDLLLVPIGVGSLGAAAARFGALSDCPVVGVGRHSRYDHGRAELRRGVAGGVAIAARWHPRHDHGHRRRDGGGDGRARRGRPRHRRVRRRATRRAARAARRSGLCRAARRGRPGPREPRAARRHRGPHSDRSYMTSGRFSSCMCSVRPVSVQPPAS
jgi:hypothetical protein